MFYLHSSNAQTSKFEGNNSVKNQVLMVIRVNSCESGNKIRRVTYLGMEHEFKLLDRRQSSSEKRGTGNGARSKVLQYFLRVIIVTTISTITNKMQEGRRMEQVVNLLKESGQICFIKKCFLVQLLNN